MYQIKLSKPWYQTSTTFLVNDRLNFEYLHLLALSALSRISGKFPASFFFFPNIWDHPLILIFYIDFTFRQVKIGINLLLNWQLLLIGMYQLIAIKRIIYNHLSSWPNIMSVFSSMFCFELSLKLFVPVFELSSGGFAEVTGFFVQKPLLHEADVSKRLIMVHHQPFLKSISH